MDGTEMIALLKTDQPKFHQYKGQPHSWAIQEHVLTWIAANVKPGFRTLETGSGYSTAVFIACGAHHTAISPASTEHERIHAWCTEKGISMEHTRFYAERSQDILHKLDSEPLDVVLIDGAHAFPFPYLDWFWTALKLKVGGFMLLDDTHIRTVHVLMEFLQAETDRWTHVEQLGNTSVFRKDTEAVFAEGVDWPAQPFNKDLIETRDVELNWKDHLKTVPVIGPIMERAYRLIK